MRGVQATRLRNAARVATVGLKERAYVGIQHGNRVTIKLAPRTLRAVYQQLKRAWRRARRGGGGVQGQA